MTTSEHQERPSDFAAKLAEFNDEFSRFEAHVPRFAPSPEQEAEARRYMALGEEIERKALSMSGKLGVKMVGFGPPEVSYDDPEASRQVEFLQALETSLMRKRSKFLLRDSDETLNALSAELNAFRIVLYEWLSLRSKGTALSQQLADGEEAHNRVREKESWPRLQTLYEELNAIANSGEVQHDAKAVILMTRQYLWAVENQHGCRNGGGYARRIVDLDEGRKASAKKAAA